jgi:hypothetical protein
MINTLTLHEWNCHSSGSILPSPASNQMDNDPDDRVESPAGMIALQVR